MKKRILTLVAALALAATVVAPVNAERFSSSTATINLTSKSALTDYDNTKGADIKLSVNGYEIAYLNDNKDEVKFDESKLAKYVKDSAVPALEKDFKTKDVKLSGEATQAATTTTVANFVATNSSSVSIGTVGGDAKDNLHDNAINPAIKEFAKVWAKNKYDSAGYTVKVDTGKADLADIVDVGFFEIKGAQAGDMTIKLPSDSADGFDKYAIVLHYTGNASDEDGVTAQYVKVTAGGKLTAHFNSYSPVAVILTNQDSAQALVNTYNHSIGSDELGAAAATTTTTATTAPVATPVETTATTATTDANAAAGKTAASPKTGDNAYALYLILAVAAVAGTTLVATKKTR